MEEPGTPKEVNQIQTFVFLDMESTGLPQSSPRVTELSMVAVSRAHLLQMNEAAMTGHPSKVANSPPSTQQATATPTVSSSPTGAGNLKRKLIPKLPRVLHKYTRLYYPWKVIPPTVEGMSGLNNEALEHLPSFTEASAEALNLFLDLPKPVSLVAHNGNRYDFPLLMAELHRVKCADKFADVQCVDTLVAIRDIDSLIEREDITEITKLAESFSIDNFEDELLEEACSSIKRPRTEESDESEASCISNTPPSPSPESASPIQGNNHCAMEVSPEPLMTPVKNCLPRQTPMPSTPAKSVHPPPQSCTPRSSQPGTPGTPGTPGFQAKVTKESRKVRRTLTYEKRGQKRGGKQVLYKQPLIYSRLFDSEYEAHRAEEDSMALLTICGHYGSKFVEWADTFATNFASVKPMWEKRNSFHTSKEG